VQLNRSNFGGHSDWRIPTIGQDGGTAELETILSETYPTCEAVPCQSCTTSPCVSPVFNTGCTPGCSVTSCSCTAATWYWSATTHAANQQEAQFASFNAGNENHFYKLLALGVRAVR